jgi:hypothetical protein
MASDLQRGAYSGKETYLYYNNATHETPNWIEIARARNVQVNDGPELADVEFHGSDNTSQIPGYAAFNGSFEYVRKRGTDAVYDAIKTASAAGDIIELMHLNGPEDGIGFKGWQAPCVFGQFAETANGGDPVVATIPFSLADAYDATETQIGVEPASSSGVAP